MPIIDIKSINNSKVFLRVDFDVPIINKIVQTDYRIKRCLPTIKLLLEQNNTLVLFTKVGRPEGFNENLSTKHFITILERNLNIKINFENDIDKIEKCFLQKITLFENTRFYEWENKQNPEFNRCIANFFDYYVDEAFAVSHREETSNFYIPQKIQKIAMGLNYLREIDYFTKLKGGNFENPGIFILGGAKAETKIPMIEKIRSKFNYIIVGGKLVKEKQMITLKQQINNLLLLKLNETGFDIDTKSIEVIKSAIKIAKTIVWNGPLGKFEDPESELSTIEILKVFAEKKQGLTIAGGGDTISAIEKYGDYTSFSFVSTGGGAMFSYLGGNATNIEKMLQKIDITTKS